MLKIRESGGNYVVTLPKDKLLIKGWKKGQKVFWNFNKEGKLELDALNEE